MKLLLDENLSPKLAGALSNVFPGTRHVEDCGLGSEKDSSIWNYAKQEGFAIVSKDSDFYNRSTLYGSPPKVIWLRIGNCTTDDVEALLRNSARELESFSSSDDSFVVLRKLKP